jgi:hypothetical protein
MPNAIARGQISTAPFVALACAAIQLWPSTAFAGTFWSLDSDIWKVLPGVGAFVMSVVALIVSSRSTREKTAREQREELKESIEKLIDFRDEFNTKFPTFATDAEREAFSVMTNNKRSIYLQSAEYLARQVENITSAEWRVLAFEYQADSNFVKAESLYNLALEVARDGSLAVQAAALQGVAWAAMMQDAAGQQRGRQAYEKVMRLLTVQNDPYSIYMRAYNFRMWANSEFAIGDLANARDRMMDGLRAGRQMPEWLNYRGMELRAGFGFLIGLTERWVAGPNPDLNGARACLDEVARTIQQDHDELSRAMLGQIYWRQARLASIAQDAASCERFSQLAKSLPQPNQANAQTFGGVPPPIAITTPPPPTPFAPPHQPR